MTSQIYLNLVPIMILLLSCADSLIGNSLQLPLAVHVPPMNVTVCDRKARKSCRIIVSKATELFITLIMKVISRPVDNNWANIPVGMGPCVFCWMSSFTVSFPTSTVCP